MDDRLRHPRICFYVSDYGYGHAARAIALARELQDGLSAEVIVRTGSPAEFMARSLPDVEVRRGQNDPGVVMEGATVDVERTRAAVERWLTSWDDYIAAEKVLLRNRRIDLVLSDIAPQPFLAAEELGIPALGISNFTWHLIYTRLFGKTDRIAEAYQAADGALLLPLHEPMEVFCDRREVGLVARRVTRDRADLPGLPSGRPLVYLRPPEPAVSGSLGECTCLVPSWTEIPGMVRIPPDETETQDWIAACDLVVSKPGYSTISEAIQAGVPMALFRREGFAEDDYLIDEIERMGIGRKIPASAVLDGSWVDDLEGLMDLRENFDKIDDLFKRDGTKECIDMLREMV